jgi:ketosteroid isomerase-like protein
VVPHSSEPIVEARTPDSGILAAVTDSDVEILRGMWGELSSAGPADSLNDELVDRWWHPELEYVEDPSWPGASAYQGRDAVRDAWNAYLDVFGSAEMQLERIVEAGEDTVALVRIKGISKGADIPFDHLWGYVCRVRDGRLSYLRACWDPEDALRAARS